MMGHGCDLGFTVKLVFGSWFSMPNLLPLYPAGRQHLTFLVCQVTATIWLGFLIWDGSLNSLAHLVVAEIFIVGVISCHC
uniref:Uncharacterized protein n=1 Tax=Rhizophora mucronata TaxID=61149 RepID=A0A2P2NY57_RHIMU